MNISAGTSEDLLFAYGIIDTIREPLLVLDSRLRVLVANRSFYRVFHARAEDTDSQYLFSLGDGQWDLPELRRLLETILPKNVAIEDFEVENDFPKIGHKIMLLNARQIQFQPTANSGSETLRDQSTLIAPAANKRILLAIEDVTARVLAERALQIYLQKLEQSNRELQDFAYIASHDLQEPLRSIQAFGERLASRHGENLDEQGRDYLARMQRAADRMRVLIHDLLAYSRVTTKAKPFAPVDLSEVAATVVSDLSSRLEEVGGEIEIGALPVVEADATQMLQLLQNLLGNALKFHRTQERPRIIVHSRICDSSASGENVYEITVADNGIGFDQKYAERIFNPFQRLHGQSEYAGTGIGLAICRKIVERHHGTISAQSVAGKGATFLLTLPAQQPPEVVLSPSITQS